MDTESTSANIPGGETGAFDNNDPHIFNEKHIRMGGSYPPVLMHSC